MSISDPDHRPPFLRDPRLAGPRPRFLVTALVFAVPALWIATVVGPPATWTGPALTLAVYAGIVALAARGFWQHYPHDRLGLCNIVTLARGALTAGVASALTAPPLTEPTLAWIMVGIASLSLTLDGVDGKLARSSGLVSDFGARFDMEVDAFFALTLALLVWLSGSVGIWVLTLGVMRYLFVAAGWFLPWLNGPLPEQVMRRKTVCVIQIAALVVLLAPPVTPPASSIIAAMASALLVWSFAVDVIWLYRRRHA